MWFQSLLMPAGQPDCPACWIPCWPACSSLLTGQACISQASTARSTHGHRCSAEGCRTEEGHPVCYWVPKDCDQTTGVAVAPSPSPGGGLERKRRGEGGGEWEEGGKGREEYRGRGERGEEGGERGGGRREGRREAGGGGEEGEGRGGGEGWLQRSKACGSRSPRPSWSPGPQPLPLQAGPGPPPPSPQQEGAGTPSPASRLSSPVRSVGVSGVLPHPGRDAVPPPLGPGEPAGERRRVTGRRRPRCRTSARPWASAEGMSNPG